MCLLLSRDAVYGSLWRDTIRGHEEAIKQLREFSTKTANEVRLIHLPTQTLIATLNTPADGKAGSTPKP